MRIAAIILALSLAGCASLGYERATVSVSRTGLALLYADVRSEVMLLADRIALACRADVLKDDTCARAAQAWSRAKALDAAVRAKIAEAGQDVTPEDLRELVRLLAGLAGVGLRLVP